MTQARQTLAEKDGTIVLRHLERLPESALRVLTAALQDAAARRAAWVAVAVPPTPPGPELTRLLRLFDSTVRLPPLRHHVEDVELLVPFLLMRLGQGGQLTVSPEAMQLLLRFDWPGNVEQLLATLRSVLRHRRTGVVQPSDLPPEIQSLGAPPAHAAGVAGARRDRPRPAGRGRQQGARRPRARDVPRDDLPQDPRLRDRRRHRPGPPRPRRPAPHLTGRPSVSGRAGAADGRR